MLTSDLLITPNDLVSGGGGCSMCEYEISILESIIVGNNYAI